MKLTSFRHIFVILAVAITVCLGLFVYRYQNYQRSRAPLVFSYNATAPRYGCADQILKSIPPAKNPGLIDVTEKVGLDFQHIVGPLGTYFMPESVGAGGAMFDADRDGYLDIYLLNCGASPSTGKQLPAGVRVENRFFRQTKEGIFEDRTERSGLGDTGYASGCAVGDVNNDGSPDVFITNYGQDRLFLNSGNGEFVDCTEACGIKENQWGTGVAFFDYDRDGWLDLFVVNYTVDEEFDHSIACGVGHGLASYCGPHKFRPTIDRLYHNEGTVTTNAIEPSSPESVDENGPLQVRFRDVTEEAGIDLATSYGFGVICADLTGDFWPDIFVANDGEANRLWVNQRDGTFEEEALQRGVALNEFGRAEAGMGVALGDINHDSHQDLLVSHLSTESSTLYYSQNSAMFVDHTERAGLEDATRAQTGWGVSLIDLDHDGCFDIPMVNGLVVPCRSGFPYHGEDQFQKRNEIVLDNEAYWREYADRNLLLMGLPSNEFQVNLDAGGDFVRAVASGRSLIHGDIDGDGDLDLLVTNCGGRARIYSNEFTKKGHSLQIRVLDRGSARDALGAIVEVQTSLRNRRQILAPQTSYLASHEPSLHFGLAADEHVNSVLVFWPDGPVELSGEKFELGTSTHDRLVSLRRGSGEPIDVKSAR